MNRKVELLGLSFFGKFFKFYSTKGTCTIICLGKFQLLSNHMAFLFCKRQAQNEKRFRNVRLWFVYADYSSTYSELLCKTESCTLELRRIQTICTEIYKTLNHMGPVYMNNLIIPNQSNCSTRRPLNLFVPRVNQATYGLRSFLYHGTLLWNSLPEEIKTAANLNTFKKLIKNWSGPACKCNFCAYHHEEM